MRIYHHIQTNNNLYLFPLCFHLHQITNLFTTKWVHCSKTWWAAWICAMVSDFMKNFFLTIIQVIYIHTHSKIYNGSAAKSMLYLSWESMACFQYWFKPKPWLKRTTFFVLVGLDVRLFLFHSLTPLHLGVSSVFWESSFCMNYCNTKNK